MVLTRKMLRLEDNFNGFTNFFKDGLKRFLRLVPSLAALAFLAVTVLNHHQEEPTFRKFSVPEQQLNSLANACTGYDWLFPVTMTMTWLWPQAAANPDGICNAWTWYVSNEFWFYLGSLVLVPMVLSSKNTTRYIAYFIISALFVALFSSLIWLASYCYFYFPYYLYSNVENYKWTSNNAPEECTSQETLWNQIYFIPFYRYGPYLVGILTGAFLAKNGFKNKTIDLGITQTTGRVLMSLVILGLLAIIYFPLPTAYTDEGVFYPQWIADLYEGFSRTLWGVFICGMVVLMEGGITGPWDFLKSDYFLIFSKINFSSYLIHYYAITWIVTASFGTSFYLSPNLGALVGVCGCFLMYFTGGIFFVIFEAPFAVICDILFNKFIK